METYTELEIKPIWIVDSESGETVTVVFSEVAADRTVRYLQRKALRPFHICR